MPFVVFDLDGTLIDGYDAIGEALAYAMERFGKPALSPEAVRVMVGHGIERLLEEAVGPERAPEGVRLFRERYPQVAVEKTRLMPDVPEVLAKLADRAHPMAVASNKPARFSRMILDAKGVSGYFLEIAGPDERTPTKPDPAMLRDLMRAAGCRVVLVPGGSRSREELEKVRAEALLEKLADLPTWLDNHVIASSG